MVQVRLTAYSAPAVARKWRRRPSGGSSSVRREARVRCNAVLTSVQKASATAFAIRKPNSFEPSANSNK